MPFADYLASRRALTPRWASAEFAEPLASPGVGSAASERRLQGPGLVERAAPIDAAAITGDAAEEPPILDQAELPFGEALGKRTIFQLSGEDPSEHGHGAHAAVVLGIDEVWADDAHCTVKIVIDNDS